MTDAFSALADPTRRGIFEHLISNGSGTATELGDAFGITRQAAAKHLGLLEDASLATSERRGRETVFQPRPADLAGVSGWIERMQSDWTDRLEVLKKLVDG